ncbi:replication initiator [Streptomyces sp. KL2]|uniref:replication initiator n=1 Tax=Streptomyces sp. KL2 TaxID=3050126 RepID=UPI00397E70B9
MATCWRLPGLEPLRLRAWAGALGHRGHVLTKSRAYPTTYAALRAYRAEYERAARGAEPSPARTRSPMPTGATSAPAAPPAPRPSPRAPPKTWQPTEKLPGMLWDPPLGALLAPEELRERVAVSRARQGLPPVIEDLAVMERVARVLTLVRPGTRSRAAVPARGTSRAGSLPALEGGRK